MAMKSTPLTETAPRSGQNLLKQRLHTHNIASGLKRHNLLLTGLGIVSACALLSPSVNADTIFGIYAGAGSWDTRFEGNIASGGGAIDLSSDLAFERDSQNFLYVAVEHPLPLIPNLRIAKTELETDTTTTLSNPISFEGSTFNSGQTVMANLDLSHTDFTGYYEILDNWISLDLGLTARNFTGLASLSTTTPATAKLDAWIPMGYARAQFDLPFTGFYVAADMHALSLDDNSLSDITLRVGYESPLRFGAEIGFREMSLELEDVEDEDFVSDLTTDGAYLSVTFHL